MLSYIIILYILLVYILFYIPFYMKIIEKEIKKIKANNTNKNRKNNRENNKTKILLIYPPYCTPATPPFSITNLYAFLSNNLDEKKYKIDILDLNIEFHNWAFPKEKIYFQNIKNLKSKDYDKLTEEYKIKSSKLYSKNNKLILNNKKPDFFDEIINEIDKKKPDIVGLSLVYSSQDFYANKIIQELNKKKVKTVIGGPAVNEKLISIATKKCNNEYDLLEYIMNKKTDIKKLNNKYIQDFSINDYSKYFIPEITIPLKSSSMCYYRKCAFCTHFNEDGIYMEYPIQEIKETILKSNARNFFFIDDMIHKKRLLEIAKMIKPLNVKWTCQLKPIKDLDYQTLNILYESGLKMIIWGVESGNKRVLEIMNKGTNPNDIKEVLKNSEKIGIKNVIYIMFGFPTETKQELQETVTFLEKIKNSIHLISISIFGLHKGSNVFNNPKKYFISKINIEKRTMLEPKITFESSQGLSTQEAIKLRKKFANKLKKINKYPKNMNFFRSHMLNIINK